MSAVSVSLRYLFLSVLSANSMPSILNFRDPLAAQAAESGGKGANLARLMQAGFPVPPGFSLRAQVFRDFISAAPDLFPRLAKFPTHDPGQLASEAAALRGELAKLSLPAGLQSDIHAALAEFPPEQSFSVRSSSTLEDLAFAAFAGQHETFLNCVGEERILAAIKDCFLSLFADRAIAYRAQLKFPHEQAAMAVVVQQMIPCEVAGVAFTINPVSGDLSELLINSNFGLGESVVSGEVPIDQFALDKSNKAVRNEQIGKKSLKVVGSSSGTAHVALSPTESSASSLTCDQLTQIAELALRVEEHYHFPQDIEWGIADNQVFLLQSRPITTIPARWTRDESAERFPSAITPLT
jgi:phosphoenolpyruvate synthase/pyruvate phosphate dikinase